MTNEEKKKELASQIAGLAEICSINGMIGEDFQSMIMGETIKVVLMACSNDEHAELLFKHIESFLAEVNVLNNKKTLNQFLAEKSKASVN